MIFYINDKEYNLKYDKLFKKYIGTGIESNIYKLDNKVLKIYKEICLKSRLREEDVKSLSQIKTNRILLPTDIIYDENHVFCGYTMKYINPCNKDEIINIKMTKLLYELKTIKNDLLLLKQNNVIIDDLHDNNFIYNKKIYLIDPGSFEIDNNKSEIYIELFNRELMHHFILENIIFRDIKINKKQKEKIKELFPLDLYISDVLEETIKKNETVYEYKNRIIRS